MKTHKKTILLTFILLLKVAAFSQQSNVQQYLNDDYVKEKQNKFFLNYEPFKKGFGISYERVFWHALAIEVGANFVNTAKMSLFFAAENNQVISDETMKIQNLTSLWLQPKLYLYENFHLSLLYSFTINDISEKINEYTAFGGYKIQISSHLFADFDVGVGAIYCTVRNYSNSSDYSEYEYSKLTIPLTLKVGYEF